MDRPKWNTLRAGPHALFSYQSSLHDTQWAVTSENSYPVFPSRHFTSRIHLKIISHMDLKPLASQRCRCLIERRTRGFSRRCRPRTPCLHFQVKSARHTRDCQARAHARYVFLYIERKRARGSERDGERERKRERAAERERGRERERERAVVLFRIVENNGSGMIRSHSLSERDQTIYFSCLDSYHKSPDSGERLYTSWAIGSDLWSSSGSSRMTAYHDP